eukprot:s2637_g10.t1
MIEHSLSEVNVSPPTGSSPRCVAVLVAMLLLMVLVLALLFAVAVPVAALELLTLFQLLCFLENVSAGAAHPPPPPS